MSLAATFVCEIASSREENVLLLVALEQLLGGENGHDGKA